MPHESRLNFSTDEILAGDITDLVDAGAAGRRGHGGFDANGDYCSLAADCVSRAGNGGRSETACCHFRDCAV